TTSAASHPPNTRSTTTFKPSQTVRSRLTRSSLHETRGGSRVGPHDLSLANEPLQEPPRTAGHAVGAVVLHALSKCANCGVVRLDLALDHLPQPNVHVRCGITNHNLWSVASPADASS